MINEVSNKRLISIVTPCYNEEENVDELCVRIAAVMSTLQYDYEHIFIDNASSDNTVKKIKYIAAQDKRVKLIVNARNFGHIRSPYYAILQLSLIFCEKYKILIRIFVDWCAKSGSQ